jgi:hypothetical protein
VSSNHFANFSAEDDFVIPSRAGNEGFHYRRIKRADQGVGSIIILDAMRAAGERDWKAWEAWLRMSFPEYRQPSTKIDVSATDQQGMNVACDARTKGCVNWFKATYCIG